MENHLLREFVKIQDLGKEPLMIIGIIKKMVGIENGVRIMLIVITFVLDQERELVMMIIIEVKMVIDIEIGKEEDKWHMIMMGKTVQNLSLVVNENGKGKEKENVNVEG